MILTLQNRQDLAETKDLSWNERSAKETMENIKTVGAMRKDYKIIKCEGKSKTAEWFKGIIAKKEQGKLSQADMLGLMKVLGR